ncbi:MAG: hypothetical protein JSS94_05960 [Bacteroidetes bacterium]|nr:hypothetical protein [Bacteroidota bacterium]
MPMMHPYHVGSVEMNYNKTSKTMEITGRFFIDDLENALSKFGKQRVKFDKASDKNKIIDLLKNYSKTCLQLKINGQTIPIQFLGYEVDKESVDIYLETATIQKPKVVETTVQFIYNLYDDQMNIVHIIVDGNRKSNKLSSPSSYLKTNF